MTLGERIQQKRKENGMSQEKLGEMMNVSRQTVYKWENDQAIPELDKLIDLADLFHVKVGWLIVEEDDDTKEDHYEEVINKISSMLSSSKPKQSKWIKMLGIVVLIYFVVFYSWKFISLESKYNDLQDQISNSNYYVQNQISNITHNVQEALNNYNSLTLNSNALIDDYNFKENTVTFKLEAQPKVYKENMKGIFHIKCGNEIIDEEAIEENKNFIAYATVPMINDEIIIEVEFIKDDISETKQIITFSHLVGETFPVYDIGLPLMMILNGEHTKFTEAYCQVYYYDKTYTEQQIELYNGKAIQIPKIVDTKMYLTEDGKKIADYTYDEKETTAVNERSDLGDLQHILMFKRPENIILNPKKTYEEHLIVTDEYGRYLEAIAYYNEFDYQYYTHS